LSTLVQVSALVFVLASMLAMGLSLTVPQIIAPLKNVRLVLVALALNFVAVPLLAWGIQAVMNLDQDLYSGLVLVATAAGAPFLPKLAQMAKGDVAFSVGLMTMLMVLTVVYMPLVLTRSRHVKGQLRTLTGPQVIWKSEISTWRTSIAGSPDPERYRSSVAVRAILTSASGLVSVVGRCLPDGRCR
jgi:ACR3 family arsenite efflux pump ArsB